MIKNLILLLSIFYTFNGLKAQEDFYKDKTITIIIGVPVGGSNNLYAREIGKFLPDHIPGNPKILMKNMPAAGSVVAVKAVDTIHPKDGTVLTTFTESLISQALLQPENVDIDFTNFNYVSAIEPDPRICYSYGTNGIKVFSELQNTKSFTYGVSVSNSDAYVNGIILKKLFNANINIIPGYKGSHALPIEAGELDGDCLFYSTIPPNWLESNSVNFFLRFSKNKPSYIPDSAEYIGNLAKTEQQKRVLPLFELQSLIYRPIIVSKEVPKDRVDILRKAFISLMNDSRFHEALAKVNIIEVKPLDILEAEKNVKKLLSMDKAIIEEIKTLIK